MASSTTQFNFPIQKGLYLQIKMLAAQEGKPMAAWMRDLAMREVQRKMKKKKSLADMPVYSFPGIEKDISQRVDEFVYKKDW